MSYQRRPRLDADESADLAGQRGSYSGDELARFEVYCAGLFRLAELSGVVCDGVARSHGCGASCMRTVPAGMPSGWLRSKWDLCPACVTARKMVAHWHKEPPGALDRELLTLTPGDDEAEKRAFFAAMARVGHR